MSYNTPPNIGFFPPSSVVTGLKSTSASDMTINDPYGKGWVAYVGPYFEIKNRGGSIVRYTGKAPYSPKNEDFSSPKVPSNIRILTLSERGFSTTGKLEPKIHSFTYKLGPDDWRVERAPMYFARNIITGEYRETDYDSYTGIFKKSPKYNFADWEVKVLYFGWRINGIISNAYFSNKQKIYCLDQGIEIPVEPGVSIVPPSLTYLSKDPNPKIPWPGFKEWFTSGTWDEKYLVAYDNIKGKKGSIQLNPWYKGASSSSVGSSRGSSGPAIFELKTQNDPSIPPTCRWYSYDSDPNFGTINASPKRGKEDEDTFLKMYSPVITDVNLDPSFKVSVLSTTPLPLGAYGKEISVQSPYTHYLSEIFIPDGKSTDGTTPYNPNSPLIRKRPNLYYSLKSPYPNQPYTSGPFCKDIDGNFFTGNIIARGLSIENYILYEVFDTPGIDNTLIEAETKEAFVFDPSSQPFTYPPNNSSTELYTGSYFQPGLMSPEGTPDDPTTPFYPFPKTDSSPRVRKIYYRYVYKENGFFLKDQFLEVNPLIKSQNGEGLINAAYEGWIHWFDTATNGINPFTSPIIDGTSNLGKKFIYQKTFLEKNFLNIINNNTIWGIRTGQYPQQNAQRLFRAEITYYSQ